MSMSSRNAFDIPLRRSREHGEVHEPVVDKIDIVVPQIEPVYFDIDFHILKITLRLVESPHLATPANCGFGSDLVTWGASSRGESCLKTRDTAAWRAEASREILESSSRAPCQQLTDGFDYESQGDAQIRG